MEIILIRIFRQIHPDSWKPEKLWEIKNESESCQAEVKMACQNRNYFAPVPGINISKRHLNFSAP